MKYILYIMLFGLGLAGLLSGTLYTDYSVEIFLGMIAPLLLAVFSIIWNKNSFNQDPQKLTRTLIKTFIIRMVFFALYLVVIFAFYDFEPILFIISFSGFFMIFYAIEALFLHKLIQSNIK